MKGTLKYTITQADLNSAARGLNILAMSKLELNELIQLHIKKDDFASAVIVLSARQILAAKKRVGLL